MSAQLNYLLMRSALDQFGQPASELEAEPLAKAKEMATRALALQNLVLQAPEAAMVQVPVTMMDEAMTQVCQRFDSKEAYLSALSNNELDEEGLRLALKDELLCDATLAAVAKKVPELSEEEALAYYQANPEKFAQPERRYARHILITVNPDFEENCEEQVIARMQAIHAELSADNFGHFAKRHSECPSAMNDGELGWVESGLLFPELNSELFSMAQGAISQPIETEVGYHILYCQEVKSAHSVPFEEAKAKIIEVHNQRAKSRAQKLWLQQLSLPKSA